MNPTNPGIPNPKQEQKQQLVYPEFVYMNFTNPLYFMMLPTLKAYIPGEIIPENVSTEKEDVVISLVLKNNERYSQQKLSNREIVEKISRVSGHYIRTLLNSILLLDDGLESYEFSAVREMILHLCEDPEQKKLVSEHIDFLLKESNQLNCDSKKNTEIVGAYIGGDFVGVDDFADLADTEVYKKISVDLESQSGIKVGDYLYRGVRDFEFNKIMKDKKFFVREETNFVDEKMFSEGNSQAESFAKQEGYSGYIIRFKTEGSFYRKAGMSPQRITSVVPHLLENIEIFKDGEWIDVKNWE